MKTAFEELESPYLDGELEFVVPANDLGTNLAYAIGEIPFANFMGVQETETNRPAHNGEEPQDLEALGFDEPLADTWIGEETEYEADEQSYDHSVLDEGEASTRFEQVMPEPAKTRHEEVRDSPSILVVDAKDKPVTEGEYAIHQGGLLIESGKLGANGGRAYFGKIDLQKPFVFEVRDRVCAILAGAFIDPDDPAIEYGGTWFDWTLVRDNKSPDATFWPHYLREMDGDASRKSVDRFWQHEHIVRRPIRVIGAASGSNKPVKIRAVPAQIRTGPIVRYTDHQRACIWIESVTPSLVRLRVKRQGGKEAEKSAYASTVRVGGRHFAIVEVAGLDPDVFYLYTLDLAPLPASGATIPVEPKYLTAAFPKITNQVREAMRQQLRGASVEGIEWLCFRTLRSRYSESLRFATGSCRWYPGDGIPDKEHPEGKDWEPDMLDKLGEWLRKTPRPQWPHFQFYGGDQIYADEIGDRHHKELVRARFASRVPGPNDPNSFVSARLIDGAWAGRFAHRLAPNTGRKANVKELIDKLDELYKKHPLLKDFANRRITEAGLRVKYDLYHNKRTLSGASTIADDEREVGEAINLLPEVKTYLVHAEPFRVYRDYWDEAQRAKDSQQQSYRYRSCNFLLWEVPNAEAELPTLKDQTAGDVGVRASGEFGHPSANQGRHVADFAEYAFLYERAWTTSRNVRTLLGNVPTFLMFDDHEVTDDWNFDASWVRMIHSQRDHYRMWPKTITDALCAYWMYQGLGNKSQSDWQGDPRCAVLDHAQRAGIDALPDLRKCIYNAVMAESPKDDKTPFQTGLSLDWHYQLPFDPPFLVPDCRSRKCLVPADESRREIDHKGDPPLSQTIDTKQLQWLSDALGRAKGSVAFIAPSTPLLMQKQVMKIMTQPEAYARAWWEGADVVSALAALFDSTALGFASSDLLRLFRRRKDLEHMIRDKSWRDLWGLVEALRIKRNPVKTLVLVSGDVHHSYCMTGNLSDSGRLFPEILQITSSGLKTTIRGGFKEDLAADKSSLAFDIGQHHLVPGFMRKAVTGTQRPKLVLYQNAVAVVDVKWGAEVDVQVMHLSGNDDKSVDKHVYQYTSGPAYLKAGEPAITPWHHEVSAEEIESLADEFADPRDVLDEPESAMHDTRVIEEDSSLDPDRAIFVDGQNVHSYGDAVAWYTARRDFLLEQKRSFAKERYAVPDKVDDLIAKAEASIKSMSKLGTKPIGDNHAVAMLDWLDLYIEALRACDRKMEVIADDRFRAARAQNENMKEQIARLQPRMRDLQRSAFRADKTSTLKQSAEALATALDSVLVAEQWVRDAATKMDDIRALGTTLRAQKAPHVSQQPWHELMRATTQAKIAKLLTVAEGLNKVFAAWQLLDSGITLLKGGKTASDRASAGISFATTVASAGGTLLGASGFFTLYTNLYLGPMVKHVLGQIDQLKDRLSTGHNHPYIQLGKLDLVDWSIEPGGREMYDFMHAAMKARSETNIPAIPAGVVKYFSKHRDAFDAGTPKRHGVDINYADFGNKRVWVYSFRDDIWGMLYGSLLVP